MLCHGEGRRAMSILSNILGEGDENEPRGAFVDTATGAIFVMVMMFGPSGVRLLYDWCSLGV
jgi:hypothetical protein